MFKGQSVLGENSHLFKFFAAQDLILKVRVTCCTLGKIWICNLQQFGVKITMVEKSNNQSTAW